MVAAPFRLSSVIRSVLIAPKRWSKAIRGSRRRAASDLNSLSTLTGQVTHDGCGTVQVVFGYQIGFDRSQAMVQGDKGQPQACGFNTVNVWETFFRPNIGGYATCFRRILDRALDAVDSRIDVQQLKAGAVEGAANTKKHSIV